ncbi:MAG: acylphosphatase [Methanomicrobiales archaeon]|nr:acylphosphatase [Methanomicrobiales archaeon]
MRRFVAIAQGRVQRVGYREHVYGATFDRAISGYVKNLENDEVEIVAEGSEKDLQDFISEINIIRRPIAVRSFTVRWEKATEEYTTFTIIRGDFQEEISERIDYAGNLLHSMDMKFDRMLDRQDQMLDRQDQTLQVTREVKEEIVGFRSDTRKHLDDEFGEIREELVSIKDALARAGIQV